MKVTEPGIYDMSNTEYHEQVEWLSSTYLKSLLPEYFKMAGSQDALDFGSLFHAVVLEPQRADSIAAELGIAVLDPAAIGKKADGKPADNPTATKAWKEAVGQAEKDDLRVFAKAKWEEWTKEAEAMAEAIRNHATAADLLFEREGAAEESAFAEVDGIPCRARFDKRIPGVILDLKSTSAKPGADSLSRTVSDYGYDLSAAHYLAVAEAAGLDAQVFALIFVDKSDEHRVTVADLDDAWLERGRALRSLAIQRHYRRVDAYEGATGFLTLQCPRWAQIREDISA